jgi:hypothetical protein
LGEETVKDKVYECMVNSSVEWDDFTCLSITRAFIFIF